MTLGLKSLTKSKPRCRRNCKAMQN